MSLLSASPDEDAIEVGYAGILMRGGARLIDIAYSYVLSFLVSVFFVILFAIVDAVSGSQLVSAVENYSSIGIGDYLFGLAASFGYHAICEGFHGSTLGKLIFGLVVLNEEQQSPCTVKQALIRTVALLIDLIAFGLVAVFVMRRDPQRQRLGDLWADTVVIRRKSAPSASLRSGLRFLGVFVIASGFAASCVGLMLIFRVT